MADFASAISNIESGGNYGLLGPITRTGDRAYGKYQVMGANIGPWTKEVLGMPMTPQQFLGNPKAQDAVFQAKFGQYAQKYGPEGAARAWFAGERGMNNPNANDQLGTTVADYARKFDSQQPTTPIQTAQGAPQMTTAPNSGVIGAQTLPGQQPSAPMLGVGGNGGGSYGALSEAGQSPFQNNLSPGTLGQQVFPHQQYAMNNLPRIQQFQQLLAQLQQQIPTLRFS
jgi:hypothetical protein